MSLERIGNYEILGEIGRGGMGVVYRGVDTFIKRPVAIKTIYLSEIQEDNERRFLKERLYREAQSAGILSHPNIVTIYQIGEQDDLTYIVMEFVEGKNLSQILRAGNKPSVDTLLSIFEQTAAGLDHAHGHGVVHRDIKPANIIVRTDGVAKITDFGVAKITSQSVTRTGMTLGTPQFMAPEQIQGKLIDGRADQYSLGVMLYEVFTGQRPFKAETITSLIFKIVTDPVDPKRDNPNLNDAASGVLKRALAKEPADRYPSCQAMVKAFRSAISAAPFPVPGFTPQEVTGAPPATGTATQTKTGTTAAPAGLPVEPVLPPTPPVPLARPAADPPAPPIPPSPVPPPAVSPGHPPAHGPVPPAVPLAPVPEPTGSAPAVESPWSFPIIAIAGLLILAVIFGAVWFLSSNRDSAQIAQGPRSDTESSQVAAGGSPVGAEQTTVEHEEPGRTSESSLPPTAVPDPTGAAGPRPDISGSGATPRQEPKPANSRPATVPVPPATPAKPVKVAPGGAKPPAERPVDAASPDSGKPPSVPAEPAPQPVFTPPKPTLRVPAVYPAAARRDGVSGTVVLQAVVNEFGQPTAVTVVRGVRPDLDQAAKDAVSKWRFQPGAADGKPVESRINVEIAFNLVQDQRNPGSLKRP